MGDISIPHNLSQADAALNLVNLLERLLGENERKKIADDVVKFHALNDTESKKAEEARSLIKRHSDILKKTQELSDSIVNERKIQAQEKISFKQEMEAERLKILAERNKNQDILNEAKSIHEETVAKENGITAREEALAHKIGAHESSVKKYQEDRKALDKQKLELDNYRKEITELDANTRAKVEAIKKYNF